MQIAVDVDMMCESKMVTWKEQDKTKRIGLGYNTWMQHCREKPEQEMETRRKTEAVVFWYFKCFYSDAQQLLFHN